MTKKQTEVLKKLKHAKVIIDYKVYAQLLENYEDLLEDTEILKSKELRKAEEDLKKGRVYRWEDIKRALHL